jgi:high affinity sulfate transporter 1
MNILSKIRWPRPFAGLAGITLADVPREAMAGVTLAALMIPLNIGYAQVAGLPPPAGLYAAIIPLVVFALLASSRHLVTSPDASMATLVGAALVAFAAPGEARLPYALALAVVCAVLFLLFWVFRLAFLANFLSRAVMAGFITGLGVEVFTNQVRKILAAPHGEEAASGLVAAAEHFKETLATSVQTEGYFVEILTMLQSIPHANLYSLAVGVSAFLIVRLMKKYAPKIPGALVALVLLTVIVALLDLPAKGVGVLGNAVPSGLPALTLPAIPLSDYLKLLPGALAIVGILLCEGLLVVRSYSNKYGYKADGDQMLFAYGAANLTAAFTGSLLTGNSPSRSAAMDASGARSQLPSLVAAGTIALVMLFFTDLLAYLPNAALAGIVANAVLSLIEVHEFRELWRMRRSEFWIASVCFLSVLALGPLRAVVIAFLMSVIDVIRRASRPVTSALLEAPDGSHFLPADGGQASGTSGLMVYRFGAPLYFANATLFLEEVERLVTQASTPVRWFVLDAQAMVDVDTTGAGVLRQAIALLKKRNITLAVSRADRSFRSWLERYDLMELIDPDRFYPTNRHAAQAFRQSAQSADAEPDSNAADDRYKGGG